MARRRPRTLSDGGVAIVLKPESYLNKLDIIVFQS